MPRDPWQIVKNTFCHKDTDSDHGSQLDHDLTVNTLADEILDNRLRHAKRTTEN